MTDTTAAKRGHVVESMQVAEIVHTAVFFGCWSSTGHGYYAPGGHSLDRDATPWGWEIDSPLWVARSHKQSEFRLTKRDGWTVIACADYSVDSRGGSMAAFCFDADLPWPKALSAAVKHFPGVISRLADAAPLRLMEAE